MLRIVDLGQFVPWTMLRIVNLGQFVPSPLLGWLAAQALPTISVRQGGALFRRLRLFSPADLCQEDTVRWSQAFIPTLRDDPADAEAISHKLLVRAGFMRQLMAGVYSLLPLGQRYGGIAPGGSHRSGRSPSRLQQLP